MSNVITPVKQVKCKRVNGGEDLPLPARSTVGAAGMDLRANITEDIILQPGQRMLIPTGIALELELDELCFVVPRSGLANDYGISIVNSPGTVDSDFRGEIKVNLINLGDQPFRIQRGDRIAQMIIMNFVQAALYEVAELSKTERQDGGHGHSGVK